MEHALEVTYEYTEAMAERAARALFFKNFTPLMLALGAALVLGALAAAANWPPFWLGLLAGYFLAMGFIVAMGYRTVGRAALVARSFPDPSVRVAITSETLQYSSWSGIYDVRWHAVSGVVLSKGFATVLIGKAEQTATSIPESAMSSAFREALLENVRSAGGRLIV